MREVDPARRACRPHHAEQRTFEVDGAPIAGPHPDRGIVFQHHTLFPWKSVRENVSFGPKMRGFKKAERLRMANEILWSRGTRRFF